VGRALTSELMLLFLYLGFMALQRRSTTGDGQNAPARCYAIVGAVNVPIIYYSVQWWNTLHQGASVSLTGADMAAAMLTSMLIMRLPSGMYSIASHFGAAWRCLSHGERVKEIVVGIRVTLSIDLYQVEYCPDRSEIGFWMRVSCA